MPILTFDDLPPSFRNLIFYHSLLAWYDGEEWLEIIHDEEAFNSIEGRGAERWFNNHRFLEGIMIRVIEERMDVYDNIVGRFNLLLGFTTPY